MRTIKRNDIIFLHPGVITLFIATIILLLIGWWPVFFGTVNAAEMADIKITTVVVILAFIILSLYIIVPAYVKLRNMEKALNIDFDEEMKKLGVKHFDFQNDDWFIIGRSFIINKKYIKYVESIKEHYYENVDTVSSGWWYVTKIRTINDKVVRYVEYRSDSFSIWYNR